MLSRPPPKLTLTSYRLPPTFAERVADLPGDDQAALAQMVQAIGVEGFQRILRAFAQGGRSTDYSRRLSLLRDMAKEMIARNPSLAFRIGGDWRRGMWAAAATVVNSAAGVAETASASTEAASLKRWLVREWEKHGRRLLQECGAAELARAQGGMWEWTELVRQTMDSHSPFFRNVRQMQAVADKFYPHRTRTIGSR